MDEDRTEYIAICTNCGKKTKVTECGDDPPGFRWHDKPYCFHCKKDFAHSRRGSPFQIHIENGEEK